jgi:hypothetical protein
VSGWALLVTCSEPDALPFLLRLPAGELERATVIATRQLAATSEEKRLAASTHRIGGISTLSGVRRVMARPNQRTVVVICPDPWGPFRSKGLIRARLLSPWTLRRGARVDLIEIQPGGQVSRTSSGLTRGSLLRRIYVREAFLLARSIVRPATRGAWVPDGTVGTLRSGLRVVVHSTRRILRSAAVVPVMLATLARLLPFVVWTEARARFIGDAHGPGRRHPAKSLDVDRHG